MSTMEEVMNHIGGMGGFAPPARSRKLALSQKGQKALKFLESDVARVESMAGAHDDSDALRYFADRFSKRKKGSDRESVARFELDQESGQVSVNIFDAETGQLELKLSPEEVAEGLRHLEETQDNEEPLSSFFVDIHI